MPHSDVQSVTVALQGVQCCLNSQLLGESSVTGKNDVVTVEVAPWRCVNARYGISELELGKEYSSLRASVSTIAYEHNRDLGAATSAC